MFGVMVGSQPIRRHKRFLGETAAKTIAGAALVLEAAGARPLGSARTRSHRLAYNRTSRRIPASGNQIAALILLRVPWDRHHHYFGSIVWADRHARYRCFSAAAAAADGDSGDTTAAQRAHLPTQSPPGRESRRDRADTGVRSHLPTVGRRPVESRRLPPSALNVQVR